MTPYHLPFIVMYESELSLEGVVAALRTCLTGAKRLKDHSFDTGENWVEIWENETWDAQKATRDFKPYLYYRYRVEVTPRGESQTLENQMALAKQLKVELERLGGRAEICADFEEML